MREEELEIAIKVCKKKANILYMFNLVRVSRTCLLRYTIEEDCVFFFCINDKCIWKKHFGVKFCCIYYKNNTRHTISWTWHCLIIDCQCCDLISILFVSFWRNYVNWENCLWNFRWSLWATEVLARAQWSSDIARASIQRIIKKPLEWTF